MRPCLVCVSLVLVSVLHFPVKCNCPCKFHRRKKLGTNLISSPPPPPLPSNALKVATGYLHSKLPSKLPTTCSLCSPNKSSSDSMRCHDSVFQVRGEYSGAKTIRCIICSFNRFIDCFKLQYLHNWSKDLKYNEEKYAR